LDGTLAHTGLPDAANGTRRLDLRYLERPAALNHRPYFEFVESRIRRRLTDRPEASLLDVGCANGAFLHFVKTLHPSVRCHGIDALEPLVSYARSQLLDASFSVGDITARHTLPADRFDVVTALTLHSHFDALDGWLDNLLGLARPGGAVLVFGLFNDAPVDILVRLRVAGSEPDAWAPGWNVHSRASLAAGLRARGLEFAFHEYAPPESWAPSSAADPLATRTAELNGRKVLMNGAGLLLPFALLEIAR